MKTPGEDDMRISGFFFGAAIAFGAGVVSASAADLPARVSTKVPMVASVAAYNWTGCYIGGNAGGGTSHSNFTTLVTAGPPGANHLSAENRDRVNAAAPGPADDAGFIGGGQVGCNWQTGSIVFGLEGDFDYFGTKPSLTRNNGDNDGTAFTITNSVKTSWLATVRPRVGLAFDRSLLYLTGGLAVANFRYTQSFSDSDSGIGGSSASKAQLGWTVGGGLEYALSNSWSVKGEYLYAQFSSVGAVGSIDRGKIAGVGPFTNGLQGTADLKTHIVRVGANYHFNNPVVARY